MPAARSFTELQIWKRSRAWSKRIFELTREAPFRDDRRLVAQVNDSSESVMSNIAEGFGRGTQGEFIQFIGYAIGSLDETRSHLCAAFDRQYIGKPSFARLFREGTEIRKMTVAFIRSMVRPGSGVKHMGPRPSFTDEVWDRYERITGKPRPEMFRTESLSRPEIDDSPPTDE